MSTVNALVAWLGSVALFAVAALVLGPVLLRLLGVAAMVVGATFLLGEAGQDTADAGSYLVFGPMALFGLCAWLLGHRLFAAQHRYWKSGLAAALWTAVATRPARWARRGRPAGSRPSRTGS